MKTGIIDEPVNYSKNEDDKLGIKDYAYALKTFIENTETPMTIGVQGEWGSGKTSLMNLLWKELEGEKKNTKLESVWINTWEHSLLKTPEETLISIVGDITNQISELNPKNTNFTKLKDTGKKLFSGAAKFAAGMASGVAGKEVVEDILDSKAENSIKDLKKTLENFIKETVEDTDNKEINNISKLVFYIDDLDRIEPRDAVKVLELLKNIFSLPYCVFILAIDYQVVVKGLKEKFGDLNEGNEREFRSFFDKIIQLPFMMPLGTYNTSDYVISLLKDIDFLEPDTSQDNEFNQLVKRIIELSIGSNPRAIKRLVNNISLMNIIDRNNKNSNSGDIDNYKILLFYVVCCQVAYPKIYELLVLNPDIKEWNEELAFEITQGKEEKDEKFNSNFTTIKKQKAGDETWEQCLYRICYADDQLRLNFFQASNFLRLLADKEIKTDDDDLILVLGTSSTTAVTAKKQLYSGKNRSQEKFEGTLDWVTNYLKSRKEDIKLIEKRSESLTELNKLLELVKNENEDTKINYSNATISLEVINKEIAIRSYNKPTTKLKNSKVGFQLIKDHKNNYKMPLLDKDLKGRHMKSFNKKSSVDKWRYSHFYVLDVNKEDIVKYYDKIKALMLRSVEIIRNNEDLLKLKKIEYSDQEIKNFEEMASNDYHYEIK